MGQPGAGSDDPYPRNARGPRQCLKGHITRIADVVGDARPLRNVEEVVGVRRAEVGIQHQERAATIPARCAASRPTTFRRLFDLSNNSDVVVLCTSLSK